MREWLVLCRGCTKDSSENVERKCPSPVEAVFSAVADVDGQGIVKEIVVGGGKDMAKPCSESGRLPQRTDADDDLRERLGQD